MTELTFKQLTQEKLQDFNYYYKTWFKIVRRQKTYIIDTHAGTGYNIIENQKVKGSALLALELFKDDDFKKLKLFFIEKDLLEYKQLEDNIKSFIKKHNLEIKLRDQVEIINNSWSNEIDMILESTQDGIRLFTLDPTGTKSLSWNDMFSIIKLGKSKFGYKESGNEVFINWGWHAIRRHLGNYYKNKSLNLQTLDKFFGPIYWKKIANKYDSHIFEDDNRTEINKLIDDLIMSYCFELKEYFKYIMIHPIDNRVKHHKIKDIKKRGKLKYFLIFATNYQGATEILQKKIEESSKRQYYLGTSQTNLLDYCKSPTPSIQANNTPKVKKNTINHKLDLLQSELGIRLTQLQKKIIIFLYKEKNHDYGCNDFVLLQKKFRIDKSNIELQNLLSNKIIKIRPKYDKKGVLWDYYYLNKLVDRREFIYYKQKFYFN